MRWKVVTSNKPKRQGEAFLMRDEQFVAKIYAGGALAPVALANVIATRLAAEEDQLIESEILAPRAGGKS